MPGGQDKLRTHTIEAGLHVAGGTHRTSGEPEHRRPKVLMLPGALRLIFFTAGLAMLFAGLTGWPIDEVAKQVLLDIAGALTAVFSIFGLRRSLDAILDATSAEGAGALLELLFTLIGHLF
ncbi:hypothetical protein [Haloferula sp. BvORR071]|uniref:hypothetical protein n=1 Tax=Haloferula sp. BvORR071 TaxID=1396141 RepID=UPI00054E5FA9|nr:hypothetical protein [Haloferula sp. BvORR071]